MTSLSPVSWYNDAVARERGEPGIYFSYMGAVASALQARGEEVDPVWLMGASGWAFRIFANEVLCPSAMSIFDWGILPEAVRNAGWDVTYVSRLWHEDAVREQRRQEAHAAIVAGIEAGTAAVVWDVLVPEWGLITGYDDASTAYDVLAWDDPPHEAEAHSVLAYRAPDEIPLTARSGRIGYDALGEREIQILSVAVIGKPNGRPREQAVRAALEAAVRHAEQHEQGEWFASERPAYQDGLPAFELWAQAITHHPGSSSDFGEYYAGHWAGARCYARDFVAGECEGCPTLRPAANAYASVASRLLDVWHAYRSEAHPSSSTRQEAAEELLEAARYEREAIAAIRAHLAKV